MIIIERIGDTASKFLTWLDRRIATPLEEHRFSAEEFQIERSDDKAVLMLRSNFRIVVDKKPLGSVTIDRPKLIVKDERFSIPRTDVTAAEIEDEGYYSEHSDGISFSLLIVTNFGGRERVFVESGPNKDDMLTLGRALGDLLDVELVDKCKIGPKPWWAY